MTGLDWRRNFLLYYQNSRCYLCGGMMTRRKRRHAKSLWRTTDHIMPRSRGGMQRGDNIAMAHMKCNNIKGNRLPHPCEVLFGRAIWLRIEANRIRLP